MTQEMLELLKDLANVLEKHAGGLTYTAFDDGIHVIQGGDWKKQSRVCIEWPRNGNCRRLREIIQANAIGEARADDAVPSVLEAGNM